MADIEKVNILIVDDLPDKLLALEAVVESLHQNVVTARSGRQALKRLTEHEFAVILLDVNMPEMDGFETAALIRQRKKYAHVPIIFVTAYADELHTSQGYSLGAVDYIMSPVVPDILRTKVSVFVELHKKTQEVKRHAEQRIALAREQAARAAAEEASRRSTFLAQASTALAHALDFNATVRCLARLVVPTLADCSAVVLLNSEGDVGEVETAGSTGSEGAEMPIADRAFAAAWLALEAKIRAALQEGRTTFLPTIPAEPGGGAAPDARANGMPSTPGSVIILPLLARGRTLGALVLTRDRIGEPGGVSHRVYSREDLALAEDLAARAAITLDNARLYRDIQESDRRKNEFLSMLAHELRNPLAPIRNALQVINVLENADPRLRRASEVINRQVGQMVRLVDDLLDLARITRGKIKLQRKPVEAADVVAAAVEAGRPLIDARNHELTVDLPAEPLWLDADFTRITQVLTNLLNNAAKYTEVGGHIGLTVARDGAEAVFRVRDTGIGLPPEMVGVVFDLFTQVGQPLDRTEGGLGIGLTLVRRLVELHGGKVEASSAGVNQGAEFTVRLPLMLAPPTDAPSDLVAAQAPARRSRRFLLDDETGW